MANALVIRKGTHLAKRDRALRAAQYVRMSTELQRYSLQNQAAAIATYAQQKNLTIVRTYLDAGRSGVRINRRPGLIELIDDVTSGRADFDHILVYDVSRWGRFQDVDESAHYEFVCKQAGVKVVYCAEQFDNDGSLLSNIVKNIKRVMAAEYSRELGVKVLTGQCRIAGLGYRVGGPVGYGLRRELIDETKQSKGWLSFGQRKSLQTDRVRLRLGSQDESAVVQWIFQQFVSEKLSYIELARQLNRKQVPGPSGGKRWTDANIRTILKNEAYIGNLVHNRTSRRLGQPLVHNPAEQWVRCENVLDPVVDRHLFTSAQKLMAEVRLEIPEEQMLTRLRVLLARKGSLSARIIDDAAGVPSAATFVVHFGSLRKAYARIGYVTKRDCDWFDSRAHWKGVLAQHAAKVAKALRAGTKRQVKIDATGASLTVRGKARILFFTARQEKRRQPDHATVWKIYRKEKPMGMLAVLRLDETNQDILDYVVLPGSEMTKRHLRITTALPRSARRSETVAGLISDIKARIGRPS